MGAGSYSSDDLKARVNYARSSGTPLFSHTAAYQSGATSSVHDTLDVTKPNAAGVRIRESRDSDEHPESEAYAVIFDHTGSMGDIPRVMVEKLPLLNGVLVKQGVSEHAQLCFGAVGDAMSHGNVVGDGDRFPLQIGQFESDNRSDIALTNIILEGLGQGQVEESYDLVLYYFARHTAMDCYEKRGVKGMLFIIGDERVRSTVSKDAVKMYIGDSLEADIPTVEILRELEEKFVVFFIEPKGGHYWNNALVSENLSQLFRERHIRCEDPKSICEVIAGLIALEKGMDMDATAHALASSGASDSSVKAATTALAAYATASLAVRPSSAVVVSGDLGASSGDSAPDTL